MKKIIAILLAIISVFAMSIPAFAAEDVTAKDVDNTFDNYTPAFGQRAPENWYDPYCYDEDGTISFLALDGCTSGFTAMYCREYRRVFTASGHDLGAIFTRPYKYLTGEYGQWGEISSIYCPYCGKGAYEGYVYEGKSNPHIEVEPITYGGFCSNCGEFTAQRNVTAGYRDDTPDFHCAHCFQDVECDTMEIYRFLNEDQRNSDYAHIFEESAYKYKDGKDYNAEELIESGLASHHYKDWNSENNPNYKPTFWQKIANFFANIIKWFQKIFGIVK